MPWSAADAEKHTHLADTAKRRRQWMHVANEAKRRGLSDKAAIMEANGVLRKSHGARTVMS